VNLQLKNKFTALNPDKFPFCVFAFWEEQQTHFTQKKVKNARKKFDRIRSKI
jgi:hypothetical protein